MSQVTQQVFTRAITAQFEKSRELLNLTNLQFQYDGFVSYATTDGSEGSVKIVCGPPEYHAEVFLLIPKNGERWNLARLMEISSVRRWVMSQSPEQSSRSVVEMDVEWIFRLLKDGLKSATEFGWLYRAQ